MKYILYLLIFILFSCNGKKSNETEPIINKNVSTEVNNVIIDTTYFEIPCRTEYLNKFHINVHSNDTIVDNSQYNSKYHKFQARWSSHNDTIVILGGTTNLDSRVGFKLEIIDNSVFVYGMLKTHLFQPIISLDTNTNNLTNFIYIPTINQEVILSKKPTELMNDEILTGSLKFKTDKYYIFEIFMRDEKEPILDAIMELEIEMKFKAYPC